MGFFSDADVVSALPIIWRKDVGLIVKINVLNVQMMSGGVSPMSGRISKGMLLGRV